MPEHPWWKMVTGSSRKPVEPEVEETPEDEAVEETPEDEPAEDADAEPAEDADAEPVEEAAEEAAETVEGPVRARKKKTKSRRIRRRNKRLTILLIFVVVAAAIVVINLPVFDVDNVSVIGNKRVEDAEVKRLSEMEDGKSLFGLNSILAAYKVGLNAYVEDVKIKRIPPSTIEIVVTEREPAAQLVVPETETSGEKYVAIDENGRVLEISDKKMDMTYIKDVDVTEAKLKDDVSVKQTGPYEKAMEIIKTAKENDMFFMRITMKGSMVDACIYGDLYCKGRFDNIISALESGNLRTVVYRLYQNNTQKGTINVGDNNYCSFTSKT